MSNENNIYNSQPEPQNIPASGSPQDDFSQQMQGSDRPYGMPQESSPFYGTTAGQEPPHKKKKWPIAVGVGAAVAVAAGAGAAYWFFFRTPSFDTPTEAITSCMSQLNEQFSTKELGVSELEDKLGSQDMLKAIQEDGMDMNLSLEFKGGSIEELSALKGTNFELGMKSDVQNNSGQFSIGANVMGVGGDVDVYYDKDTLAVSSQDFLPDSYLALNKSDLLKKLESMMDEEDRNTLNSLFDQQYTQASLALQDFTDYCVKQLPDSLVSFAKDWEVEEDTSKDTLQIGEQSYKCYTYDVTITAEAFKEFLTDYCDYLAKYDYDGNQYFTMLEQSLPEKDESIADAIKDALEELPESLNEDSDDKLEMTMYVSKDGKLLGMDIMEKKEGLEVRFGGENPGKEIYFNFNADNVSMDCSLLNISEGNSETTELNMSISEDRAEMMTLNCASTYHPKDDTFDISMKLSGDEDTFGSPLSFTLSADGSYKDVKKGVGFTTSYDTMKIALNADDESYTVELSGEMYYGALTDKVKKPSGTEYDLLNMTEEQSDQLLKELKQNSLLSTVLSDISGKDIVTLLDEFWKGFAKGFPQGVSGGLDDYSDFDTDFSDDDDDWLTDDDTDDFSDDDDDRMSDDDTDDFSNDNNNNDTNNNDVSLGLYSSMEEYVASSEIQSQLNSLKNSFDGMGMSIDMRGEGNKLIYSYKYDTLVKEDGMAEMLESEAAKQADVFVQTAASLKTVVSVNNPVVVIEYIDANGEMIFTKEYAAK